MKRIQFLLMLLFASVILFSSCGKDDPEVENEEEVITTLNYTLTSSNGEVVILSFVDLDGDGGESPVITGGTLMADSRYTGTIELLNATESPAENVTEEIEEEAEEHQFFFSSSLSGVTVDYEDRDADGNPIGLISTLNVGSAGTGTLTIVLRHEPMKDAEGVSDGDISNADGETDIEVTFPIDVQ